VERVLDCLVVMSLVMHARRVQKESMKERGENPDEGVSDIGKTLGDLMEMAVESSSATIQTEIAVIVAQTEVFMKDKPLSLWDQEDISNALDRLLKGIGEKGEKKNGGTAEDQVQGE
jgi:hypothetical protein